ncbi:MAG: RNA 2',3'-cyclic phosphodiesterase [Clostridia bacterium]|nr:RNA 2',3'-cyclic phosphodiesterase [Clostridia bacterium]
MRLFISVELSEKAKETVLDMQTLLRAQNPGIRGNFISKENFHITLAFIGEYPDDAEISDILSTVRFKPFTVSLDRVGSFGDLFWVGTAPSRELSALAFQVRRALGASSIPYDRKPFKPHITFLRRPDRPVSLVLPSDYVFPSFSVSEFHLMSSTRGKHGMIYQSLACFEADREGAR